MRGLSALLFLLTIQGADHALADQIEVAPRIAVTRKVYPWVALNEAPFFNFQTKTIDQAASDARFVASILAETPDKAAASRKVAEVGTRYFQQGDLVTAAMRYNQAYLLDPEQSGVYHGFALIAASRFDDTDFADELFRVAERTKEPAESLYGDHGRLLLLAGRPNEAIPILQRAVQDMPDWAVPRSNLGVAFYEVGDMKSACEAIAVMGMFQRDAVEGDIRQLKKLAKCP